MDYWIPNERRAFSKACSKHHVFVIPWHGLGFHILDTDVDIVDLVLRPFKKLSLLQISAKNMEPCTAQRRVCYTERVFSSLRFKPLITPLWDSAGEIYTPVAGIHIHSPPCERCTSVTRPGGC